MINIEEILWSLDIFSTQRTKLSADCLCCNEQPNEESISTLLAFSDVILTTLLAILILLHEWPKGYMCLLICIFMKNSNFFSYLTSCILKIKLFTFLICWPNSTKRQRMITYMVLGTHNSFTLGQSTKNDKKLCEIRSALGNNKLTALVWLHLKKWKGSQSKPEACFGYSRK